MTLLDIRVQQLLSAAFSPGLLRLGRSTAFKTGVEHGLYMGFGRDMALPFAIGTAEADAYLAGLEEGRSIATRERACA